MSAINLLALRSAASDRESLHALRATLKYAGRRGLRAVYARELKSHHQTNIYTSPQALGVRVSKTSSAMTVVQMDMRQFKKPRFLKVDDVRNGPRQMRIAGVLQGKYEKPDLVFENGDKLGLSATNIDTLAESYGWDSNSWTGHLVELSVGKGEFAGEEVDMVLLKPISKAEGENAEAAKEPAKKKAPNKPPQLKAVGGSMDDEIPFAPEWR
jgi:hypothetical protein